MCRHACYENQSLLPQVDFNAISYAITYCSEYPHNVKPPLILDITIPW